MCYDKWCIFQTHIELFNMTMSCDSGHVTPMWTDTTRGILGVWQVFTIFLTYSHVYLKKKIINFYFFCIIFASTWMLALLQYVLFILKIVSFFVFFILILFLLYILNNIKHVIIIMTYLYNELKIYGLFIMIYYLLYSILKL